MNQLSMDFDALGELPERAPTATAYNPDVLIIRMQKGSLLGNLLKDFTQPTEAQKKGDVLITLTREGIRRDDTSDLMKYPKGVLVQGHGTATLRAENVYRILGNIARKVSFQDAIDSHDQNHIFYKNQHLNNRKNAMPYGLAEDRTTIRINGTVEVTTGNFKAVLATVKAE